MIAWMAREASDIYVVEIVIAKGRAVGEACQIGRRMLLGADDRCAAISGAQGDLAAGAYDAFVERGYTASDGVDEMRFDPFDRSRI